MARKSRRKKHVDPIGRERIPFRDTNLRLLHDRKPDVFVHGPRVSQNWVGDSKRAWSRLRKLGGELRPAALPFRAGPVIFKGWRDALVCAKRRVRKEVMFSMNVAGRRGAGGGKPRKTNDDSKVRC